MHVTYVRIWDGINVRWHPIFSTKFFYTSLRSPHSLTRKCSCWYSSFNWLLKIFVNVQSNINVMFVNPHESRQLQSSSLLLYSDVTLCTQLSKHTHTQTDTSVSPSLFHYRLQLTSSSSHFHHRLLLRQLKNWFHGLMAGLFLAHRFGFVLCWNVLA